jgi:hypothetical protein
MLIKTIQLNKYKAMKEDVMNNQKQYFVEWDIDKNEPLKTFHEECEDLDATLTIWHFTSIMEDLNWCDGAYCGSDDAYGVSRWMSSNCELVCFDTLSDEWKQKYISANTDLYK